MIKFKKKLIEEKEIDSVLCNKCGKNLLVEETGLYSGVEIIAEGETESRAVCGDKQQLHLCDDCYLIFRKSLMHEPQFESSVKAKAY